MRAFSATACATHTTACVLLSHTYLTAGAQIPELSNNGMCSPYMLLYWTQ